MSTDFSHMTDAEVIDFVQKGIGAGGNTGAVLEMQRRSTQVQGRLIEAVSEFDRNMRGTSNRLVALAEETSKQTNTLVLLTKLIIALTVVLGVIAALQLVAMFVV